jgi:GNAT superfamily N-acetyltransferase
MTIHCSIRRARVSDAAEIAVLVGELLTEIMATTGTRAFSFNLEETADRCADFIDRETYFAFVAHDLDGLPAGFIALQESHALYTQGVFGTIPEFYVRPQHRSHALGHHLLCEAKAFATSRGWRRLEVTTPPLPQFERSLAFYEREGFCITGGRKLKLDL